MTHNGFANYETWLMNLWLSSDEYSYSCAIGLAEGSESVHDLARHLEKWMDTNMPDLGSTVWGDLLNAAVGRVDWREIAGMYEEHIPAQEEV